MSEKTSPPKGAASQVLDALEKPSITRPDVLLAAKARFGFCDYTDAHATTLTHCGYDGEGDWQTAGRILKSELCHIERTNATIAEEIGRQNAVNDSAIRREGELRGEINRLTDARNERTLSKNAALGEIQRLRDELDAANTRNATDLTEFRKAVDNRHRMQLAIGEALGMPDAHDATELEAHAKKTAATLAAHRDGYDPKTISPPAGFAVLLEKKDGSRVRGTLHEAFGYMDTESRSVHPVRWYPAKEIPRA
jgi:hypothetical protein